MFYIHNTLKLVALYINKFIISINLVMPHLACITSIRRKKTTTQVFILTMNVPH